MGVKKQAVEKQRARVSQDDGLLLLWLSGSHYASKEENEPPDLSYPSQFTNYPANKSEEGPK